MSRPLAGLLIAMLALSVAAPSTASGATAPTASERHSPPSAKGPDVNPPAPSPTSGLWVTAGPPASDPISEGGNGEDGGGVPGAPAPAATAQPLPAATPEAAPLPSGDAAPTSIAATAAAPAGGNAAPQPSPPAATVPSIPEHGPAAPSAQPSTSVSPPVDGSLRRTGDSVLGRPASSAFDVAPSLRATGSNPPASGDAANGDDTSLLPTPMTLAVVLAGLVAIAGAAMLVTGRRREVAAQAAASRLPSRSAAQADDPIVAAMDIAPETALRARRARRLRESLDERAARGDAPGEIDPPMRPVRPRPRRRASKD